jgi:hypothetical protein
MTPLDDLVRTARIDATHYANREQLIKPIDNAAAELAGLRENAYASAQLRVENKTLTDALYSTAKREADMREALEYIASGNDNDSKTMAAAVLAKYPVASPK